MNDLISRQEAIDIVEFECGEWHGLASTIAKEIKMLPSAQSGCKTGKWIVKGNPRTDWYRVTCSECGEDVTSEVPMIGFPPNGKILWDYCPYCGAEMEGENDE